MFGNKELKRRIEELEEINEQHRTINGQLREELDHWIREAGIWKDMYEKELRGEGGTPYNPMAVAEGISKPCEALMMLAEIIESANQYEVWIVPRLVESLKQGRLPSKEELEKD